MRQGLYMLSSGAAAAVGGTQLDTQGTAASRHQTVLKPPALSWFTLLTRALALSHPYVSPEFFLPYTCQNWAWGFTIWCSHSPQSIRWATGSELQNFNLHRNSCSPQWRKLPCVERADRQQQGCRWHFVKRMVRHRVHGTDFRLSKKLPGREWAALDTKCLTAYFQASCELTMLESGLALLRWWH